LYSTGRASASNLGLGQVSEHRASALLDRLFVCDGRTLTEVESELEMTRFGSRSTCASLEDTGLVVTRRSGREKLHCLNPVPIRLIHDRRIDKYTEHRVSAPSGFGVGSHVQGRGGPRPLRARIGEVPGNTRGVSAKVH